MENHRRDEALQIMKQDEIVMQELVHRMQAYQFAISSNEDGKLEMQKIRELATQALKILVNYI